MKTKNERNHDKYQEEIRMIFVGQPNIGKSSLLNALVGPKVEISNYPGTSVEIIEAMKIIPIALTDQDDKKPIKYYFQDTPGIYSISDRSLEETVTKRAILAQNHDVVINILDATALERGLYFALQVIESGQNMVLGINFIEDAYRKGISVNVKKLVDILGISVAIFNPIKRKYDDLLKTATDQAFQNHISSFKVHYDDHIEEIIDCIIDMIPDEDNPRFCALRILEEDSDFIKLLSDKQLHIIEEKKKVIVKEHPNIIEDISKTRYGTAAYIASQVSHMIKVDLSMKKGNLMDKILLNRVLGPIITGFFFVCLFLFLFYVGGAIEGAFSSLGDILLNSIPDGGWAINGFSFLDLIKEGITGVVAGIAIALPYVFLFYIILGLIEDIGLLPRFMINIQRGFELLGIPSRSFISMILGVGCSVPAITSTRILRNDDDRFKTGMLFSFIPCSSRLSIIFGIVGYYGGGLLAFSVFGTLIIAMILWALILKVIMKLKREPMLIELPPYRSPKISNVGAKSWIRMREFVTVVIPLLIGGSVVFSILEQIGITNLLIEPFQWYTQGWLNLPAPTIIPLIFGFLQKDLTSTMLESSLSLTGLTITNLTQMQLFTFGIASCLGVACVIALSMGIKEYGWKRALLQFVSTGLYGILIAGIVWRLFPGK